MKLVLKVESYKGNICKVIYCDPTEIQLDKFVMAVLEAIKLLGTSASHLEANE